MWLIEEQVVYALAASVGDGHVMALAVNQARQRQFFAYAMLPALGVLVWRSL
jgi:hypothetical protein